MAVIVASAQDWEKAQKRGGDKGNQYTGGKVATGNVAGLATVDDRRALSGAGDRTQRNADKLARADRDLALKVAHGEMTPDDPTCQERAACRHRHAANPNPVTSPD